MYIVASKIGSVKIGGQPQQLTVGNQVPSNVLSFWERTKQLEPLKSAGVILTPEGWIQKKISDKQKIVKTFKVELEKIQNLESKEAGIIRKQMKDDIKKLEKEIDDLKKEKPVEPLSQTGLSKKDDKK